MMTTTLRQLHWDGCYNIRDLGGLPTQDGGQTSMGALIRADMPSRLTVAGEQALLAYGVRTIIDLRTLPQTQEDPYPLMQPGRAADVRYLHLPLENYTSPEQVLVDNAPTRAESYARALRYFAANIATILRAIATAPSGGILFHCQSGRDRTGLISALLLSLANVGTDVIAADYAASEAQLWPLYHKLVADAADDPVRLAWLQHKAPTAPPETILAALQFLDEHYGSVEQYLLAAGLAPPELTLLRQRLRSD
ncbi:MAG: tyrosine-protein phosphatase [Caldilinea sp. CFX5]|nr:tyrosine-protein phosphatase [Caldilinea sp. CFX5]